MPSFACGSWRSSLPMAIACSRSELRATPTFPGRTCGNPSMEVLTLLPSVWPQANPVSRDLESTALKHSRRAENLRPLGHPGTTDGKRKHHKGRGPSGLHWGRNGGRGAPGLLFAFIGKGCPTSHLHLSISHQDPFFHNGLSQPESGTIQIRRPQLQEICNFLLVFSSVISN